MRKISDSIQEIIDNLPFIKYGISQRLINISSLARFIKPAVEAKTKKQVTINALIMNISRISKKYYKAYNNFKVVKIDNLVVHAGLCTVAFERNQKIYKELNNFYIKNKKDKDYIILIQREDQITVIMNEYLFPILKKQITDSPIFYKNELSSVGVKCDPEYQKIPGLFLYLIQQVTLQGMNIWELSSSYSDLTFYLDKKDVPQAFEVFNGLMTRNK